MKLKAFLILTILLLSLSVPAQTKRALVIGLGKQQDPAWNKINGDRDVALLVPVLKSAGYRHIVALTNARATKAAVVRSFKKLTDEARKGDIVYIHFSGHGQRMTDVNSDENDGWDESWIPYDAYRRYGPNDRGEKHLSDDEIAVLLTRLRNKVGKNGDIVVVVDACHSGDSTRDLADSDSVCVRGVFDNFVISKPRARKGAHLPEQWLTLSACKNYQVNFEHPKGYGKLTYAIYSKWKEFGSMSNRQVESAINRFMQQRSLRGRYPQSPVMSGNLQLNEFRKAFAH